MTSSPATAPLPKTAPSPLRRFLAIGAVVSLSLLAWNAAQQRDRELRVNWLLTGAEWRAGALTVDRSRLIELAWRVPKAPGSAETASAGSLHWPVGQAPEIAGPVELRLPPAVESLEVRCVFGLDGTATARTRGTVAISAIAGENPTVSVDQCGSPEP